MVIIIICFVVLIIGLVVQRHQDAYADITGFIIALVGGMALFVCLLLLPVHYYDTVSKIESFRATQETITVARDIKNDFESATIQLQVIENNKWLAETKYWNGTLFDIWIPDTINDLEFIK